MSTEQTTDTKSLFNIHNIMVRIKSSFHSSIYVQLHRQKLY